MHYGCTPGVIARQPTEVKDMQIFMVYGAAAIVWPVTPENFPEGVDKMREYYEALGYRVEVIEK